LKLYELDNDISLGCVATANYIRGEVKVDMITTNCASSLLLICLQLARALRKGPFQTNVLFGGYDKTLSEPALYYIDYMGSMAKMNYGAHGYAASFVSSVLDREWQKRLTVDQGLDVLRKCVFELRTRFLISQPKFIVKIVDANGIRVITL
jgi:20S proteasome subunit beta 4